MRSPRATDGDAASLLWQTTRGGAEELNGMSMRAVLLVGVALAFTGLASCADRGADKTDESSAERVAAALDVCAEPQGEFARSVCQNQALAGLDDQISDLLVAESAAVSDAGAEMLVQNQHRWLEAQRISCGVLDPQAELTGQQQQCLEGLFRSRLEDARTAVQSIGGYTFQRMELVDAIPVTAEIASASRLGDGAPRAVVRNIRFPRIDGPQTPQVRRFNELVAQQPQYRLEDSVNETVDYVISFAGPELVSVKFIVSQDMLGAANVTNSVKAVNVLMSEGRPLVEGDIFVEGSGWQDFITGRAVDAIAREFSDYPSFPPRRDVFETATKPHLWLITDEALVLLFPPLSFGGSHADGGAEVRIPWADLRPYLNPAAPAPIRPSA